MKSEWQFSYFFCVLVSFVAVALGKCQVAANNKVKNMAATFQEITKVVKLKRMATANHFSKQLKNGVDPSSKWKTMEQTKQIAFLIAFYTVLGD